MILGTVFVLDPLVLLLSADVDTLLVNEQHFLEVKELACEELGVILLEVALHLDQLPDIQCINLAFIGKALGIQLPFERRDVLEPVFET